MVGVPLVELQYAQKKVQELLVGVSSCHHVMNLCLPVTVSFVDSQNTALQYYLEFQQFYLGLHLSLFCLRRSFECLREFLKKTLWSKSSTKLPTPRSGDALTDFIASSTLGITKFSFAVNTADCILVRPLSSHYPPQFVLY